MKTLDAEEVLMVNSSVVASLGLDPDNVRSVFMSPATIEVDYVNPEEAKEVKKETVSFVLRWALQWLEIREEPMAFYFSPRLIKVRTMKNEYTYEGTELA